MPDSKLRRYPEGDPRATAERYHHDMFQRRQQNTVSIRKERKEERLWRRRQPQFASNGAVTVEELLKKLDAFLESPHEPEKLRDLQTGMATDSASTNQFLKNLIDSPDFETKNRLWIANLCKILQQNTERNAMRNDICKASFAVLMELTAFSSFASKPSADHYYGMTPLRWSDLIQEDTQLIDLLLAWLREPSVSKPSIESVCMILGNLLQDSARLIPSIIPAWANIVQRLPVSSYLCAALIRQDSTHFGTLFLNELTPTTLACLLRESGTAMEASFILEGLSRREEEALTIMCESSTLVSSIVDSLKESAASSNSLVLVPLLRAIRNLFNGGPHASILLSHSLFIPTLLNILEQGVEMYSLEVANAILSWNGIHGNDQLAMELIPALLPVLVRIITSPDATFPWKRDAAWAVCCSLHHEWSVDRHAVSPQLKGVAVTWLSTNLPVPQSDFVRSLAELLSHPDLGAVASAAIMLDVLLRTVEPMRHLFENVRGVECLEMICERGGEGTLSELASNLAAELLDDIFEADDEEAFSIVPFRGENEFVFGIVEPAKAFNFGESNPPGSGRGRGRGRTTPAWMHQS